MKTRRYATRLVEGPDISDFGLAITLMSSLQGSPPQHLQRGITTLKNLRVLAANAVLVCFLVFGAGAAAAQSYAPVGPQQNVPVARVTGGGWTECFRETYDSNGAAVSGAVSACAPSSRLMMACRVTGSSTIQLLAQAATADVTFVTPADRTTTHIANSTAFYFNDNGSWGFATAGSVVDKRICDAEPGSDRMCWHTDAGVIKEGYRCGDDTISDGSYERILYMVGAPAPTAVPTLSEWAMIAMGLVLAGGAALFIQRRRIAA